MSDEAIGTFVAGLDFGNDLLVALPGARAGGFRGVVQASRHPRDAWELAFSTAPAFQRHGIATLLGRWMLARLAGSGASRACIFCAPENIAMRGLARKLGFSIHVEGGEVAAHRVLGADAEWGS
jgi:RimJ/RimL family protein N-acetyltransferase